MDSIRKVYVSLNTSKKEVMEDARFLVNELSEMGFQPFLPLNDEHAMFPLDLPNVRMMKKKDALAQADFMLVVGGDGTMLFHAKDAARAKLPMLGVNMGKLGFMNELDPHRLPLMKNILDGNYTIDRRMMLDVEVRRDGETVYMESGLNDAVITKGDITRVISVGISSNGEHLLNFSGDGVIVCTPTGSTAYSLSAGGPVVEPTSENLIITPICPHVLYARAFILSSERIVMIEPGRLTNKCALLSVDGGTSFMLHEKDKVVIKRSQLETKLIRISGRSFYELVNQKLSVGG